MPEPALSAASLSRVVTRIEDPLDERIRDYVGLTDMALRTRLEPERGLYLAESEKVIRRALRAGHRPRSFLMGSAGSPTSPTWWPTPSGPTCRCTSPTRR